MKAAQRAAMNRRTGTWLEQTTPVVDDTCPRCDAPTLSFCVELRANYRVHLDTYDVPITTDLFEVDNDGVLLLDRVWTFHGDEFGWTPTYSRRRTWRRVRAEHRCDHKNKQQHKEKQP